MLKPDILQTLSREGIEVTRNKAHCPLHEDDTPSLFVYPDSNSWYCYGCCVGGDAVEFIRKHRGMSYREAVAYLGIREYIPNKRDIKKRQLINEYKTWMQGYTTTHNNCMRLIDHHVLSVKSVDDMNPEIYHLWQVLKYRIELFFDNDGKDNTVMLAIYADDSEIREKSIRILGELCVP